MGSAYVHLNRWIWLHGFAFFNTVLKVRLHGAPPTEHHLFNSYVVQLTFLRTRYTLFTHSSGIEEWRIWKKEQSGGITVFIRFKWTSKYWRDAELTKVSAKISGILLLSVNGMYYTIFFILKWFVMKENNNCLFKWSFKSKTIHCTTALQLTLF